MRSAICSSTRIDAKCSISDLKRSGAIIPKFEKRRNTEIKNGEKNIRGDVATDLRVIKPMALEIPLIYTFN